MKFLLEFLCCCRHRFTFPRTPVNQHTKRRGEMYQVCVRCGAEFPYDWETMTRGPQRELRPLRATGQGMEATG